MPSYDYRCNNCKRRVVLKYKTYAEFDNAIPTCPNCKGTNLTRLISRVAIGRSESNLMSSLEDESAMDDLANADPATLGRYMRRMSEETGEDLGDEFNEVVNRLERGEDPEAIESSMPDLGSEMAAGGAGDSMIGGMSDDF